MSLPRPARRTAATAPLLAALALALAALPALAQDPGDKLVQPTDGVAVPRDVQHARLKEMERTLLWKGARREIAEARKAAKERREARRPKATRTGKPAPRGEHASPVTGEDYPVPETSARLAAPLAAQGIQSVTVPANVRANNPATDTRTNATQSEESIVSLGNDVLASWNDGEGTGGNYQGYGWSVDGGATFTDGGIPPIPPGWPLWTWNSDPVMAVNEKTGRFYYAGLADPSGAGNSALGVAMGHFTPSAFVWDTVVAVRVDLTGTRFYDKEWIAADSSSNSVYVTNTTFTTTTDFIDFMRSSDGGATWAAATQVSRSGDNGFVQGSRPAVGPNGEVYLTWMAIGRTTDADNLEFRKSTDHGASFGTEVTAATFMDQFGTGAPGFNRERGIGFPSIVADRTTGPHRGRVYLAWNETWDIQATGFSINAGKAEVEPDNSAGTATPFTPGNTLRGYCSYNTASAVDLDYFSFTLSAGQSVVFWADSLPARTTYTMRVFAGIPDSAQRLAYGGELDSTASAAGQTFYSFLAPVAGTYYLRMAPAFLAKSRPFRYRILTAFGSPGVYRARDQRDPFVAWTDDGTTWATPVRVNDSAVGFDDFLPEVAVGPDGCAYETWFDYRNDTYGSRCHQYAARSADGGATWQANARFTDAQSNFTTSAANLAPNMGDYSSTFGDARYVRPAWADARSTTSVDVWTTAIDTWFTLTSGPANQNVNRSQVVNLPWTVNNLNPLFANDYAYTLTSTRNWPMPAPGTLTGVAAADSGVINLSVTVPDTASGGTNLLTLTVQNAQGTLVRTGNVVLSVFGGGAGVGPGVYTLALAPARPNPASGAAHLRFTLPAAARATLRIYGLNGQLVRTLADGTFAAGPTDVAWDGRDESGRAAASGAYFVRLETSGRTLTQRLVWMR